MSTETGIANRIKNTLKSIFPWVLATCIGGVLLHATYYFFAPLSGMLLVLVLPIYSRKLPFLVEHLIPILSGLVLGFLQWAVLRKKFSSSWPWIVITALSFYFSIYIETFTLVLFEDTRLWFLTQLWLTMGLVVGLCQWFYLRSRLDHAGWWVPATALGFVLGGSGWEYFNLIGAIIGWAISGILTGIILHNRIRQLGRQEEI